MFRKAIALWITGAAILAMLCAGCATPYGTLSGTCLKITNLAKSEGPQEGAYTISSDVCLYPATTR